MGRMNDSKNAITRWEGQVEYFPRVFIIADSSRDPEWFAKTEHRTWKIHRSYHLCVSVQWHRLDKKRKWWNLYFEFGKSHEILEEILARTLDVLGRGLEKKWYATLSYTPEGKWDSGFKGTGHPVLKSISALRRGILKKKNGRDTIHFNADASNTELTFRNIHSVSQLSIHGAVANWCEQFGLTEKEAGKERQKESVIKGVLTSVKSQEVKLLVSRPKRVSGSSLREKITTSSRWHRQFTRVCELALFRHRVSPGMNYKTRLDEDDSFGQIIPLCREYTLSRVNPQSRVFAAIPGGTITGPVIEVQIVKILDQDGLEIAIPWPNGEERTSHVMIYRGQSLFVEELHIPNAVLRSSAELLTELQKAEGEECAVHCVKSY